MIDIYNVYCLSATSRARQADQAYHPSEFYSVAYNPAGSSIVGDYVMHPGIGPVFGPGLR